MKEESRRSKREKKMTNCRKKRRRGEGKWDDDGGVDLDTSSSLSAPSDQRPDDERVDGASSESAAAAASATNRQSRKRNRTNPKAVGKPFESSDRYDDIEEEEDEYLRREAEAWAQREAEKEDDIDLASSSLSSPSLKNSAISSNHSPLEGSTSPDQQQPRSVHVTQIPFSATELDLRRHFAERGGCLVSSVRLVYDRGIDLDRQFRGVAFVDVPDDGSFAAALRLDKSRLMGRRINVRPTRPAFELSKIVQETQKRLVGKKAHTKDRKEQRKRFGLPAGRDCTRTETHKEGEQRKLTRKERNRRAAIIRQRRKGDLQRRS
jgi:hypothetical protein